MVPGPLLMFHECIDKLVTQSVIDPDAELMFLVRGGNHSAFQTLVEKYQKPITNFIYHFVLNREEAEDLAQEVFLNAYRAAERYRPEAKFSTWIHQIAVNLSLKKLRSNHWKRLVSLEGLLAEGNSASEPVAIGRLQPDFQLENRELIRALELALHKLPKRQRTAVLLQRFEGFSYREIAETMECSVESVEALLSRAKQALKKAFARS